MSIASTSPVVSTSSVSAAAHRSASRCGHPSRKPMPALSGAAARFGGLAGLGLAGAAVLGAAPAHAAPVEFPDWATVTGTIPEDTGLDRAAAEASSWTFSWSTDAQGIVTFAYADGSTSSSADPVARAVGSPPATAADLDPAPDPGPLPAPPGQRTALEAQDLDDPLWAGSEAADTAAGPAGTEVSPGIQDLAAAAADPFGAPTAPDTDRALVATAREGLGGAYVWGGTDYRAWDCSAFVRWVYAQQGLQLPRVTWDQFAAAAPTADPRPGDLVSQNGGSHVGIYLGGDRMISALNPQQGTIEHSVHAMPLDGYYTLR